MFKNYFKTPFRNAWRNKSVSFLNISGLAIGIACVALIFLCVEDEVNINHNRQLEKDVSAMPATSVPLANTTETEIAEIKGPHMYPSMSFSGSYFVLLIR